MQIHIDDDIIREFEYILKLHRRSGQPLLAENVEGLINYALLAIARGSKDPDSWEREIAQKLGLIVDHDSHYSPRGRFGKPG
ncbi:MAG: hypothetical protein PHH59_07230 [Methylovulum sp.]|uniref:hypothetical protein n=1 Tax=Methylovulum sp. TaxID=1916980 RepID=UPI002639CAFC|nr:hypothetical protein [Methylovulum sp.]MDD2723800.1 hypothetical protein [Methylovulum sp.]MDD5125971.1 hypothetical protein [Methylovulum sp.]